MIQGKTELEIYSAERLKLQALNKSSKLNGYITSEDYELYKSNRLRRASSSFFSENSFSFSQSSMVSQNENLSQSTLAAASQSSVTKAPMGENQNNAYNVLRENVDSEQRTQKATVVFSGKDQKNVSPYSGDSSKHKLLVGGKSAASLLKAKRQISFDA